MLPFDWPLPPLYAHRLGRGYGPDSSAAALRGALAAGVDGLETDVCLTADGALVLLHDPYLPLGTDLEGFAHERTARELRRARLRDREGRPTAEAPLFVEDLLAAAPRDVVLQLEVKAHADPALAGRTVDALVERLGSRARGQRIELLSFTAEACARAAALGCPARLVVWADYVPAALVRWARRHGVGGVCVEHFLLSASLMGTLRGGGLSVTTGTLNEPALLDRIVPLRPDAVTSDRPHTLREAAAAATLRAA
jgi:glycerophosphoryl diester phosphodiesterase